VPDLVFKLGRECAAGDRLAELTELSHFIDEVAGVLPNQRMPYVGDAAFAHKGGIHVSAVSKDPSTYEHVDPARVGNRRRILVSVWTSCHEVVTVPGTGQVPIGQVRFGARRGMGNRMVAKAHEVPLPPPEQPERRRRRDPAFERPSIAVDGASVWVADVRRSA